MISYLNCTLCPRRCQVNRTQGETGFCGCTDKLLLARAALHFWEEPCISGDRGSGAVFFSGCTLRCIYCQNHDIANGSISKEVTNDRLVEIFFELKEKGAHNINLVTPTHFVPTIMEAIQKAKSRGFDLPFVYNTSGYESKETLQALRGLIDIYLADYRYSSSKLSQELSFASDYPDVVKDAFDEMVSQTGPTQFDENNMMVKGTIARILLLPSQVADAKLSLLHLYRRYQDDIYISLMQQYTPMRGMMPPYDCRVTEAEYINFVHYAETLGVKNAFTQEREAAEESFIPSFDYTGV